MINEINLLLDRVNTPVGMIDLIIRDAKTGRIKSHDRLRNTFMTLGKNAIAQALSGNVASNSGQITYCALGTNALAPTAADTKLGTEIARKLISVRSATSNVATFQTFFTIAEGNGSLKEAGLFGGTATGSIDSGTIFCHAAINRTKSASDTLTLSWTVTVG